MYFYLNEFKIGVNNSSSSGNEWQKVHIDGGLFREKKTPVFERVMLHKGVNKSRVRWNWTMKVLK